MNSSEVQNSLIWHAVIRQRIALLICMAFHFCSGRVFIVPKPLQAWVSIIVVVVIVTIFGHEFHSQQGIF